MSGRLLDTNVLIDLVFGRFEALNARFTAAIVAGAALLVSPISLFEYRFGAERSKRREFQLTALSRFLASVAVVDFDQGDAIAAAHIKADLARTGTMIGPYDLLIAAQGLTRNLIVVTSNTGEFSRVTGLDLEDWRQP